MAGLTTRWIVWCLPVALAAGCASEPDDSLNTINQNLAAGSCGLDVLPSPQTLPDSACDMGRTVYGPVRIERAAGAPASRSGAFSVETDGPACVTIRNGVDGASSASAATVAVDDEALATPSNFSQNSGELEWEEELGIGAHTIDVELAAGPTAVVEVEVRERFRQLDAPLDIVGAQGALLLTNVATDHPLLTPNGDGHNDDTVFNAEGVPLIELPGEADGSIDYFLEWSFVIVDLDDCSVVPTGIAGRTQVNSPTNVRTTWDGRSSNGDVVREGNYAYFAQMALVSEDGQVYDTASSPSYGMTVESSGPDYDESPQFAGTCDPEVDAYACACPTSGPDEADCRFEPAQDLVSLDDPSSVDTSAFLTTAENNGRYSVTADLRTWNGGGLVVKGDGVWESVGELRDWVSALTGVPAPAGERQGLFNFDYVQLGTSTAVTATGRGPRSFNHLLLDAITDELGAITIDGTTIDVWSARNDDVSAQGAFAVQEPRIDSECTEAANVDDQSSLRAKFCAYNEGIPLVDGLGLYSLRTTTFDVGINDVETVQEDVCSGGGCSLRTFQKPADTITVESQYYTETNEISFAFDDAHVATNAAALSIALDRERDEVVDGVCSRSVVEAAGLRVRMDSADGAVPETCVTNGIFF